MSIELNKPYTVTVKFVPPLSSLTQYRTLPGIFSNHLFVLLGMNKGGANILTMATTAKMAKTIAPGKTLFEFGVPALRTRAVVGNITPGAPSGLTP